MEKRREPKRYVLTEDELEKEMQRRLKMRDENARFVLCCALWAPFRPRPVLSSECRKRRRSPSPVSGAAGTADSRPDDPPRKRAKDDKQEHVTRRINFIGSWLSRVGYYHSREDKRELETLLVRTTSLTQREAKTKSFDGPRDFKSNANRAIKKFLASIVRHSGTINGTGRDAPEIGRAHV